MTRTEQQKKGGRGRKAKGYVYDLVVMEAAEKLQVLTVATTPFYTIAKGQGSGAVSIEAVVM